MTRDVFLRPEAERDLAEAASWYEEQRPGLGSEFLDEALTTLSTIAERPLLYPKVHGNTRRALIQRFPFGIYYLIEEVSIVVVAVMHASRNPRHWRMRT